MADVFISYSREDIAFARLLHQALGDNDMETWIDWQDIPPSADWLAEVYEAIEQAETFIFIISETSVISEVCSLEIAHAKQHNKRLIPIVINDIDPTIVPSQLAALNWIFFNDGDAFSKPLAELIEAIQVDQDWVKTHTRYLNRALEWERTGHDPSLLLRGGNLTLAERWLTGAAKKSPQSTPIHYQYILASRQYAARRQRITLGAVLGVLAISTVMGVITWVMRNTAVREEHVRATAEEQAVEESHVRATAEAQALAEVLVRATAQHEAEVQRQIAEEQSEVALARQLAAQALNNLDQLDLALLLSVESSLIIDTREGRSSLLKGLVHLPHLQTIWHSGSAADMGILATSMNMKYSAMGSDESILVWDWEKWAILDSPAIIPMGAFEDLAICADGMVSFVRLDGTLTHWALNAQSPVVMQWGEEGGLNSPELARFSLDATLFASGSGETIHVWDAVDGKQIGRPMRYPGWVVTGLGFSQDGKTIAAGYRDPVSEAGAVLLWDWNNGRILGNPLLLDDKDGAVTTLVFHSADSVLTTVGSRLVEPHIPDKGIKRYWDLKSGQQISDYGNIYQDDDVDMAFSQDGVWAAIRSGLMVDLFAWQDGKYRLIDEFTTPSAISGVTFTPDGENLITGGTDGKIYVWDLQARDAIIQHPFADSNNCMYLAFSPDGDQLFSDCWLRGVVLWDVTSGSRILSHEQVIDVPDDIYEEEPNVVASSPDGTRLASGYDDHSVVLWDAGTLTPVGEPLRGNGGEIEDLEFSSDGRWLVAGSSVSDEGDALVFWLAEDGLQLHAFGKEQFPYISSLAFSPVDDRLAVGGSDGETGIVWFIDDIGRTLAGEGVSPSVDVAFQDVKTENLAFNNDGRVLVAAQGQEIHFYDVEARQEIGFPYYGHDDEIRSVALSPDERLLASGSSDSSLLMIGSTTLLWDLQSGKPIDPPLPGEAMNIVYDLAFSPDGSQLASSSSASDLVLWDVTLEAWQEYACQIANRNLTEQEWSTYLHGRPYHPTCPGIW